MRDQQHHHPPAAAVTATAEVENFGFLVELSASKSDTMSIVAQAATDTGSFLLYPSREEIQR